MLSYIFSLIASQAPPIGLINEGIFSYKKKEFSIFLTKLAIFMAGLIIWSLISKSESTELILCLMGLIFLNLRLSLINHSNNSSYN